jgi:DNA-binding response OmpR family regulator
MAKRLLVVDDEADFLEILTIWLKFKGYEVETALDGFAALEKLEGGNFNLILLDLMMPRLNGFDFCQQVRESEKFGKTPIVVLTAVQRLSGYAKAHDAGADAYLEKMASNDEIYETVEKVLREKGAVA